MVKFGNGSEERSTAPPIWGWYVALCVLMALMNFGFIVLGLWMHANAEDIAHQLEESHAYANYLRGLSWTLVGMGVVFGIGNLALPLLPKKPWAYMIHLTNTMAAVVFICPAVLAVPVLIFWIRPDVKRFFGIGDGWRG